MKNMLKKLIARLSSSLPLREGLGVGLLLLVGSASLMAQDDPFGDFNFRLYSNNVMISVEVMQNGGVVTDAVVAVYCGEELRGKERVGSGTNPNLAFVTFYGDYTGYYQHIDFKVYTKGTVFSCAPGLDVRFIEEFIASNSAPYILTLPLSIADDADNSSVLTAFADQTVDVALTGRTLWKDGDWNTLCLPFSLGNPEAEEGHYFDGTLLEGATVKTLESTDFEDGVLTINFEDATTVVAGQPYIVKWEGNGSSNFVNPVFENVIIGTTTTAYIETEYMDFVGTHSSTVIYEEGTAKHNLYLGNGNTLYYPTTEGFTVNACRAYFQLKNGLTAGDPADPQQASVRAFVLNFGDGEETDGIQPPSISPEGERTEASPRGGLVGAAWYTLDGRRLSAKPAQSGIYINNGKKIVIK